LTLNTHDAVHAHAFLNGLSPEHLDRVAALAEEVRFADDELVFADGQNSRALYLLIEGSVAVELRTVGFVVCVQSLGPGQIFGWSSLLDAQDTLFQVRAREQIRALQINGAELRKLCKSDPTLAASLFERILKVVASRVKATEVRFAEMCGIRV
jgi:CRP-like cAMP-binding protein